MTHMTGYFKDLKPASVYWVKCILSVEGSLIESEWQNVETACDCKCQYLLLIIVFSNYIISLFSVCNDIVATKFVVTPAENSITINVQNNSDVRTYFLFSFYNI